MERTGAETGRGSGASSGAGSSHGGASSGAGSSHDERHGLEFAGWLRGEPGSFRELLPANHPPTSWFRPSVLWASRNDRLAHWLRDPTDDERRRWVAAQRQAGVPEDLVVRDHAHLDRVSFMVLGDPGEGDASQFAVVPALRAAGAEASFMVICSDVIYPAGDVNEYMSKFYFPYKDFAAPIYAVPGNHDWYDDLTSFMVHFCGARPLPPPPRNPARWLSVEWLRQRLWRRPRQMAPAVMAAGQALRPRREGFSLQPGPYFAIETGPILLVGIDTGITGGIDADQARWLRKVSTGSAKPKVLLSGNPLYADAGRVPGAIEGSSETVDDIVRDPRSNYVAAIGGDRHNYQRYPVRLPDGRTLQYVVTGGGGAFMHATHNIPRVELDGVDESDFRCYPLRGDSLSMYANNFGRRRRLRWLRLHPDAAAAVVATRLGLSPVRNGARDAQRRASVSRRARLVASLIATPPIPDRLVQRFFSELFDWDQPPMFKSFLRVDATADELRIRCFQATGWLADEQDAPVEDEVRIALGGSGA